MFFEFLFWILVIEGAYLSITWLVKQNKIRGDKEKSSLEIEKVRYSICDLSKEESLIGMLT